MLCGEGLCWFSSNQVFCRCYPLGVVRMCLDWQVTLPRSGSFPEIAASQMKGNLFQLTAYSPNLSLAQPHTKRCLPLQEYPLATNPRLAEPHSNRNYPFETCVRSGVSFIHTYLFLCKSSNKYFNQNSSMKEKDLEIRHLFSSIAENTTTRSKILNWATLALTSTL